MNNYLYELLCRFCKGHLTHYVLYRFIASLEKGLDNSGLGGAILMDHSKAYNSLRHDNLIVKLETYGLDKPSLNLVNGYFSFWKQQEV